MSELIYIPKNNLKAGQLVPTPEDLTDWYVSDYNGENLRGKEYDPKNDVWIDIVKTEDQLIKEFQTQREINVSKITVEVDGMVFDGDEESTTRMLKPLAALIEETDTHLWVLHDNKIAYPTKAQFRKALTKAGQAQTALWVQE